VFFQVHSKPGKEYFQFAALPSLSQSISTPITNTTTPQEPPRPLDITTPGYLYQYLPYPTHTVLNFSIPHSLYPLLTFEKVESTSGRHGVFFIKIFKILYINFLFKKYFFQFCGLANHPQEE
jgi:hypothetical protein